MHVRVRSTTEGEALDYELTGTGTCAPVDAAVPDAEHDLVIEGGDAENPAEYTVRVTGEAERAMPDDYAEGGYIEGVIAGGRDAFTFTGEILTFDATDTADVDVSVDGETVDPAELGVDVAGVTHHDGEWEARGTTEGDTAYEVEGGEVTDFVQTGGDSDWVLEVDGEPVAFGGPDADPGEGFGYPTKQQVRAFVECHTEPMVSREDVYGILDGVVAEYVSAALEEYDLENDDRDGDAPADDGDTDTGGEDGGEPADDLESHHILVGGGSQQNHVTYQFAVSGAVDAARRANPDDRVFANTVQGEVRGGADTYTYTGDLLEFTSDDPDALRVEIDGEPVEVAEAED